MDAHAKTARDARRPWRFIIRRPRATKGDGLPDLGSVFLGSQQQRNFKTTELSGRGNRLPNQKVFPEYESAEIRNRMTQTDWMTPFDLESHFGAILQGESERLGLSRET
jgi:hypothetical protein